MRDRLNSKSVYGPTASSISKFVSSGHGPKVINEKSDSDRSPSYKPGKNFGESRLQGVYKYLHIHTHRQTKVCVDFG